MRQLLYDLALITWFITKHLLSPCSGRDGQPLLPFLLISTPLRSSPLLAWLRSDLTKRTASGVSNWARAVGVPPVLSQHTSTLPPASWAASRFVLTAVPCSCWPRQSPGRLPSAELCFPLLEVRTVPLRAVSSPSICSHLCSLHTLF